MSKHKHTHFHKHCRKCKKQRHAYDLYLRRTYGISLKKRNEMDKSQRYKCGICRRPPKKNKLAVDHDHKLAKLKVKSFKRGKYWYATVDEFPTIRKKDKVRKKAIKAAKLSLLRRSIRGLLCWACNTGIRKYFDNANNLLAAANYLKKHQSKYTWRRYGNK